MPNHRTRGVMQQLRKGQVAGTARAQFRNDLDRALLEASAGPAGQGRASVGVSIRF